MVTPLLAWTVDLVRPWWLLVLLLGPGFWWFTWRASRGRPRAADWSALGVRTFLLVVVALALTGPRVAFDAATRSVAFVLDVSESIPPADRTRMQEFIARSVPFRAEDDDAAFVVFADGAAVEAPFSRISATERVDTVAIDPTNVTSIFPRGESDIEGALRLARAGFPPGGARRVVLLTDGNQTRGDSAAAVEQLLADDVDVQIIPVRYSREREVHVRKLVAPASASKGMTIPVRAVVTSTHDDVDARVRFTIDGEEMGTEDVVLTRGNNVFQLGASFKDGGNHRLEVTVEPASGSDGNPANNTGLAVTNVRGDPRVLVVSAEEDSPLAASLATVLDATVEVTGPEGTPTDPSELVVYDGIVLENVPAWLLSAAQQRFLAFAVEELGIGLVCVGGTGAYGPGAYAGTPLEEVLPVSSEVKQKRVLPSGALIVILHTCEFPGGNEMGRQVTKLALNSLSSQDEFGCVQWGFGQDDWVVELQRVGDKSKHYSAIDKAQPGDMPTFGPAMQLSELALRKSTAATKHMIIISDGDASPPSDKLVQRIADQRITISTVQVDPHGGMTQTMQNLAKNTGGRYYLLQSDQKDRIPQIFIKEAVTVRRSAWKEEPFRIGIGGVHDMISHFAEDDFPALRGYTITTLKPNADLILVGPESDPLLATWRHGLGEVTAWTSDASKRWAQDWMDWGGYGRFWGQVVRSTMRALERPGLRVATDVDGGTAHVVLDALAPDGDFLNRLTVRGTFVDPDGEKGTFDVMQTGPGRYEGRFPATRVGVHLATLTYEDPDGPDTPQQVSATACVAYSAEHLAQAHDERFFALAESHGAEVLDLEALTQVHLDDPEGQPDPALLPWLGEAKSTSEPLDLWPWIAALAAFLLVTDVAVRRVRWKFPAVFARREKEPKKPAGKPAVGKAKAPAGHFRPEQAPAVKPADGAAPKESGPETAPPPQAPGKSRGLLGAKRRAKKRQDWEEN